ncbi:MAG: serine protease [Caldilineaceae bacterium]
MMRRSVLFITIFITLGWVFVAISQKASAQRQTNFTTEQQPDIIGGQVADEGEYPWQAYIETSKNPNKRYMCGGSLIAAKWVLTAAHCVYDDSINQLLNVDVVVLGANDLSLANEPGRQYFGSSRVIVHPSFNAIELDNDLALIELDQEATVTSFVSPVGLATSPDEDWMLNAGVNATVTGWGETETSHPSRLLLEVSVDVVDNQTCQASYANLGYGVSGNMVCAGFKEGGKDTCRGDSGGPLVVPDGLGKWKQIGIVSWGNYPCAQADFYGVYTRVPNYVSWIMQQTGGFDPTPTSQPTDTPSPTDTPTPTAMPAVTATTTPSPTTPPTSLPTATPEGSPTPISNLLTDSDFETLESSAWYSSSVQGRTLIRSDLPVALASGTYVAWLGEANDEESRLWQPLILPASKPLYLMYDYAILSSDPGCFRDVGKVYLGSQRVMQHVLCSDTTTLEWQHEVINLERFTGQVVNLQFFARTNASLSSAFFVDNIRVTNTLDTGEAPIAAIGVADGEAGEPGTHVEASARVFLPLLTR